MLRSKSNSDVYISMCIEILFCCVSRGSCALLIDDRVLNGAFSSGHALLDYIVAVLLLTLCSACKFSSVQFRDFSSGLSDKHHYKDHYSVKCKACRQ